MAAYHYNRLVIIGNGMDLALGLKTSYSDFLCNYIRNSIRKSGSNSYEDELLKIERSPYTHIADRFEKYNAFPELVSAIKQQSYIKLSYKGILGEMVQTSSFESWVDIENYYFNSLLSKVQYLEKNQNINFRDYKIIKDLNKSWSCLIRELDNYILGIEDENSLNKSTLSFYDFSKKLLDRQQDRETCLNHEVAFENLPKPSNTLFLNFNYTSSMSRIFKFNGLHDGYDIINIHGHAGSDSESILFGYGDDSHPSYSILEDENHDSTLEFIKAFQYSRDNNYHQLLNFIDSDIYEIFIVGHSCGLSDRILLKTIFEHDRCLSIKIFHRGELAQHIKKNMAISRHFSDKLLFRKRVLPFDRFAKIPQTHT